MNLTKTYKFIIIYPLMLFLICTLYIHSSSLKNNFYQLVLQCIPQKPHNDENNLSLLKIFYKGKIFSLAFEASLGGQANIFDSGEIPSQITVVVSDSIHPVYSNDQKIVTDLMVEPAAACWYEFSLQVIKKESGGMSYTWMITPIDPAPEGIIPRDGLLIQADPDYITFEQDDSSFSPTLPATGSEQGSRILFLPLLKYINESNNDEQKINSSKKDYVAITQCHIKCY